MKKKIIFQLFFFLIILFLSILFFIKYFHSEEPIQKTQIINEVSKDMISDIKYESSDSEGNRYLIKAKSGTSLPGEDNKIKLKNVEAKLTFDNNEEIVVNSDFAIYDQNNFNTEFFENVKAEYEFQKIKCDNLKVLFTENKAILKNNLIYENLNTKMFADQMDIDLISRTSKIFMLDNDKKVKVTYSTNNGIN